MAGTVAAFMEIEAEASRFMKRFIILALFTAGVTLLWDRGYCAEPVSSTSVSNQPVVATTKNPTTSPVETMAETDSKPPVTPPEKPAKDSKIPVDVKAKVEAFRTEREKYLAQKNEAVRSRRETLTQEQKAEIREKIKVTQEEYRKRLSEIKEDFKNKKESGELIDAAKDKKNNRRGED
jgi:hypothetical protein